MTKQRQVILEELQKLHTHPTAADLYHIVCQRLPRISLGTVYRNLELLVDSGVARKIQIGGREARFDATLNGHDHIFCIRCSRVDDLPDLPAAREDVVQADVRGWQIRERRIEFAGICPDCSASGDGQA